MSTLSRLVATAVTLGLATATLAFAPAASAQGHHHSNHADHRKHGSHHHGRHHHGHHHSAHPSAHLLTSGLVSPLRVAVAPDGTAYVSENFTGTIDRISPGGTRTHVYTDPHGYEVGGLSLAGSSVLFTVTQSAGQGENLDSWLKVLSPSGHVRTIADLHSYEAASNPDQHTTYGFAGADTSDPAVAACLATWPADNGPAVYQGAVDSHPYATSAAGKGGTYVADAGANAVFLVSPSGTVSTAATLPAIPYTITAEAAAGMGLDPCFVGKTYSFEPVPTDVEVGTDGTVYVTSLPGGPEGPQLGARGSVFAFSSHGGGSHPVHQVATGLLGATGLAVGPKGTLYVAQMFGDMISKVSLGRHGATVTDAVSTPTPGDVAWTSRGLYFTSNVLSGTPLDPHGNTTTPNGQLIRYGR